ncbi:hypothetical protein JCM10450v2_008216 [Rhodotorula kratochvilovae]
MSQKNTYRLAQPDVPSCAFRTLDPDPQIILRRGPRSFIIARPDTLAGALTEARILFPSITLDDLVLERETTAGWVRLTESAWAAGVVKPYPGENLVVLQVEVDNPSDDEREAKRRKTDEGGKARKSDAVGKAAASNIPDDAPVWPSYKPRKSGP